MNSDIPNISKLSPLAVVKTDKQLDAHLSSGISKQSDIRFSGLSESTNDSQSSNAGLNSDAKTTKSNTSLAEVKDAVDKANSLLQVVKRNLQFKVDDSTHEVVVKIVDGESGETVRQIPSEEMLALLKRMHEEDGQQGLMIQDRA